MFAFANVQGQLAGGETLSSELLEEHPAAGYPHGLHNAAHTVQALMAGSAVTTTATDDTFVGIIEQLSESFDLLDQRSEISSDSKSDDGSSHPSHECYMEQLVPVPVQAGAGQENLVADAPEDAAAMGAPPDLPPGVAQDQLQARRRELKETHRQLAAEETAIEREL